MALYANTVSDVEMPPSSGLGVAQSLAVRQRVLRAALSGDRSALVRESQLSTSLPLVDAITRRWLTVFDGSVWEDVDAGTIREGGAVDPSLVVELQVLRVLDALNHGAVEDALSTARRASRMAASESILQGEYLANLVLARARRHSGMGHFAIRVLSALDAVVPPVWKKWIALESALAGARVMTSADAGGFSQLAVEINTLASIRSTEVRVVPDALPWARGQVADVPYGLRAPSDDPLCLAIVVAAPERRARRILRAGLPSDCSLVEPSPKARRLHEALCLVLSEPTGLSEVTLFEKVYGYPPEDLGHDGVLRGLLHRMRKALEGLATLDRDEGRVRIDALVRFAVPDPRCETRLDDRILTFLAARQGRATAKDIAGELQIPLRTVQRKLGKLVEQGACNAESDRKRTEYVVEDTTFSEPTLHRLRGKR